MSKGLQQDVNDIVDAIQHQIGQLFLLTGSPNALRTITGRKLASVVWNKLYQLTIENSHLKERIRVLENEVDGQRSQNEILTNMLEPP